MAASIGKVFEKEVVKVMKLLFEQRLVAHQRFADSGAAGTLIAEQPADYLVGLPPGSKGGRMFFLEVKASEELHTLGKAMVKASQRGAIARWRHLLQLPYYILFWDAQDGTLQLWDGIAVHDTVRLKKEFLLAEWRDIGSVNRLVTQRVADHLVEYFHIPPSADTLANLR